MERRLEGMGLFLSRWMLALCLAVLGAGLLLGGTQAVDNRRALVLAALALFIAFYPVLTGLMVPVWYTSGLLK